MGTETEVRFRRVTLIARSRLYPFEGPAGIWHIEGPTPGVAICGRWLGAGSAVREEGQTTDQAGCRTCRREAESWYARPVGEGLRGATLP